VKCWLPRKRPHVTTAQKTTIAIFTALKTSDVMSVKFSIHFCPIKLKSNFVTHNFSLTLPEQKMDISVAYETFNKPISLL
jgi:hypothetical protein